MKNERESNYTAPLKALEILSADKVPKRASAVGAWYARYLGAGYLKAPVARFLSRAAQIPGLDAVVIAIHEEPETDPTLAVYAIENVPAESEVTDATDAHAVAFEQVFEELDEAVLNGPRNISTSFEFVNRRGIDMGSVTRGIELGTLRSLCGIRVPGSSCLTVLTRE